MQVKLTIDHLSRTFKGKVAINDISTELTRGVYGLIGPNGAGKTTFMRMLADVLRPTGGDICLNGISIRQLKERYRDVIGYLPQDCGMYPYFTAYRFLSYMAALKGLNRDTAERKIHELLALVNLSEQTYLKIGKFSGGMKRRLGIAQALLNDPKVLILDEPTAGLDPKERVRFRNLLSDISGDRIVLLSTHIITDIEYIAKEVLILKDGAIIRQESPDAILGELMGKVWQINVPASRLAELERQYVIGNLQRKGDQIEARIISDHPVVAGGTPQPPRLEDIYLYYFGEPSVEPEGLI